MLLHVAIGQASAFIKQTNISPFEIHSGHRLAEMVEFIRLYPLMLKRF